MKDVEEIKDVIDASTPIFVKHTEAILEETDEIACVWTNPTIHSFIYLFSLQKELQTETTKSQKIKLNSLYMLCTNL